MVLHDRAVTFMDFGMSCAAAYVTILRRIFSQILSVWFDCLHARMIKRIFFLCPTKNDQVKFIQRFL